MPNDDPRRLVSFEGGGEAVSDEVCDLSRANLEDILAKIMPVYFGKIDYKTLQVWRNYEGVPLYLAEIADEIMIYSVEKLASDDDIKLSFMFAGRRSRGYHGSFGDWDGTDDKALWGIVEGRCRHYFRP